MATFPHHLFIPVFVFLFFFRSISAATLDGIPIQSSVHGQGPKTVILVHGWTCDETTWQFQVPELAKRYRVITLDLPGHGKSGSPKNGKLSMDLFARAVEAVRAEAKIDRAVLVGHSMGTPVIIQYARLFPRHVAGLVLVDGSVRPMPGIQSLADRLAGPEGINVREAMIRGMFTSATSAEMQKKILSMMLSAPEATAVGAMKSLMAPEIWIEDEFAQSTLGLYADKSTAGNRNYMKTRFRNLEYFEIPGTGHFLMLEKPAEFNRLLLAFLDRQMF